MIVCVWEYCAIFGFLNILCLLWQVTWLKSILYQNFAHLLPFLTVWFSFILFDEAKGEAELSLCKIGEKLSKISLCKTYAKHGYKYVY